LVGTSEDTQADYRQHVTMVKVLKLFIQGAYREVLGFIKTASIWAK
jgi:hypothetical protein